MLTGFPKLAPHGLRAFDTNSVLTADRAAAFRQAGYRAAIRYVRRAPRHDYDISAHEAEVILKAGLALGIVQHVAPENWQPTAELGSDYGLVARRECEAIGLPMGVNVWCDLEGVSRDASPLNTIAFLNNWWKAIAHGGYLPGLYVGWQPGLTANQLYASTRFQYYWAAYNLNADQYPSTRGVCMQQGVEQTLSGIKFDPDSCSTDHLGNRPTFLAPSEFWPES